MERHGATFDCQRFRDIMLYSMSVFSFSVPEAVRVLADTLWRPQLKQEEVGHHRSCYDYLSHSIPSPPPLPSLPPSLLSLPPSR